MVIGIGNIFLHSFTTKQIPKNDKDYLQKSYQKQVYLSDHSYQIQIALMIAKNYYLSNKRPGASTIYTYMNKPRTNCD